MSTDEAGARAARRELNRPASSPSASAYLGRGDDKVGRFIRRVMCELLGFDDNRFHECGAIVGRKGSVAGGGEGQ